MVLGAGGGGEFSILGGIWVVGVEKPGETSPRGVFLPPSPALAGWHCWGVPPPRAPRPERLGHAEPQCSPTGTLRLLGAQEVWGEQGCAWAGGTLSSPAGQPQLRE